MKTVLLPREWNSTDVPPETEDRVIIDLGSKIYEIGKYAKLRNKFYDNDWDEIDFGSIRGWCYLIQQ